MPNGAKVTIDREGCTSCGLCWTTCPDFFEENLDDSFSQITEAYRVAGEPANGLAPAALLPLVREAADSCPVTVITVVEGP